MKFHRFRELAFAERTHAMGDTTYPDDSAGPLLNDADRLSDMSALGA